MLGLALIVAAVLFYKAYKLTLNHNRYIQQLLEENRRLRAEAEAWKARYEGLRDSSEAHDTNSPEARIRELAQKLELRKNPLL